MPADASLRECLLALRETAGGLVPLQGVGLIKPEDPEHLSLTYADTFGTVAYRLRSRDVPEAVRPPLSGLRRLAAAELAADSHRPFEARVLLTDLPDEVRERAAARQVVALPVAGASAPTTLVLGLARSEPLTRAEASSIEALGRDAARDLERPESAAAEIERLRRLAAVGALLPELFRVLDVRAVFDRMSALTKAWLPHDIVGLGIFSEDRTQVMVYAHTSDEGLPAIVPTGYPRSLIDPWLYGIVDDLTAHPIEREAEFTRRGGRSSLRLAIRLAGTVLGGINFTSREPARYTGADLAIGRRIADYMALVLWHQRLAEEARRAEELRARTANAELLDELLASVTDTGEVRDVFDRVSAIAKKVLPHDALGLPVLLPDGVHARLYATSGVTPPFNEIVEVPQGVYSRPDWEFDLVENLQTDPTQSDTPLAAMGYRSALRVPIRLDGRLVAALDFVSRTTAFYKTTDVPVARRIADRLALALSREKRVEALRRADEATARALALESRVRTLTEELNARAGYRRVIGDSPEWRQVLTQATQVAATETTVLLLGESGTGKEVVARFVHGASPRQSGPFTALNCAALPENLLEAELFGYERGAFTGAVQSKPGRLEQAAGGTLFLDEVAEMSLSAQAKFLRVLQEREFQRLGGTRVLRTDARVVAATNRDLLKAIERGHFREDLYYRLNVFAIRLPPLRERRGDILPLCEAFVSEIGRTLGRPPGGVSREARQSLVQYDWPGNVRELRNVLERAAILADGGLIAAEHLSLRPSAPAPPRPSEAVEAPAAPTAAAESPGDLRSIERGMIERALQETHFNKSEAAKRLGLSRAQLYVRLRRHGLDA